MHACAHAYKHACTDKTHTYTKMLKELVFSFISRFEFSKIMILYNVEKYM